MLLGYIYNDFIENLFLKHSSCTCQEKFPGHAEDPNVAKQQVDLYCTYAIFYTQFKSQETLCKLELW